MEGFRTTRTRWACSSATVGALSTFYPDAKRSSTSDRAQQQIHRLIAQGAEHRRLRLPPQHRPAVRLSRQRPELHRQLPEHAVQDDRAEVQAATRCSSGRSTCCSSCTPITSRTAAPARCARIGSSHVDPYSALAGAAAALYGPLHGGANEAVLRMLDGDRLGRQRARVHQAGEGRRRPADGLRPPRLQVVRPARQDHQADRRRGVRGHRQEPAARHRARARTDRAGGRILRHAQALSERRLLLRA